MKRVITFLVLMIVCLSISLCGDSSAKDDAATVVPPSLKKRTISPSQSTLPGEQITLNDGGTGFTLFIPQGWSAPTNGEVVLTIHFHSAPWFAIEEHVRHGLSGPFLAVQLGAGSSKYRVPFEDRQRFGRLLKLIEQTLQQKGAPKDVHIAFVEISSFSAGYGAVREILKSPEYMKIIRRIVLCDSIYAGFENATNHTPARADIAPWLPFVQAAARGEKTFVLTHSQGQTVTYASSGQCAAALIMAVGAPMQKVATNSVPAASDPDFPLLYRSDLRNFHVWGYGGDEGEAHMTHMRHLADTWMALDNVEKNPGPRNTQKDAKE